MVKVKLKQKNPENHSEWIEKEIYLHHYAKSNLDDSIKMQHKKFDSVWFVDGMEGSGKSTLAITYAYYVSPPHRRHNLIDRIIVKIEDADKTILEAEPFDSIVIDEAYGGMSAAGWANKINQVLKRRFTEIRAKNLFVFILSPSFMDISPYFAIWRSRCLLHVYCKGMTRGNFIFFNYYKKRILYIEGKKKKYNYNCVSGNFLGNFTNELANVIDEDAYQAKKTEKNLEQENDETLTREIRRQVYMEIIERNNNIEKKATQEQMAQMFGVGRRTISRYSDEVKKKNDTDRFFPRK